MEQCGGVLTKLTNALRHPATTNAQYKNNQHCIWLVDVPQKDRVIFNQVMMSIEPSRCK